jgi:hypothetical protein
VSSGFSGEDDGRDVEASGGAAAVIAIPACADTVGRSAPEAAPAETPPQATAGAVNLCEHAMILMRAVAAYERIDNTAAVTLALVSYVQRIGAGPLARAVLDEMEHHRAHPHSPRRAGGSEDSSAGAAEVLFDGDDLHAVPVFRSVGENRFRGGGP